MIAGLLWLADHPRVARRTVVGLLAVHACLLVYSGWVHSPTQDEPAHLVAGISHWRHGRFDLYRVNPPLVRMVASLPVVALCDFEVDWRQYTDAPGTRPEIAIGSDFVEDHPHEIRWMLFWARLACLPFSLLGAAVCYAWARDLYGRASGVFAAALWCFSPTVLGHASLISPDAHAAALGVAACYSFWRLANRPSWLGAVASGVVLGVAELAKTTLIVLLPLWPLVWVIQRWRVLRSAPRGVWLRDLGLIAVRTVVCLYVLNFGYGFQGTLQTLGSYQFVSELFGAERDAANAANRFVDLGLGALPVPLPRDYLLGVDTQQADFEVYGEDFYVAGVWREHGVWWYYAYAALVKMPLGFWALCGFVLVCRAARAGGPQAWTAEAAVILPAAAVFSVVSAKTGINEHWRYALPALPGVWIWVSQAAALALARRRTGEEATGDLVPRWAAAPAIALVATVLSALWATPHHLSYFNEAAGGPRMGPKHLLGSNVDWGQDAYYADAARTRLEGGDDLRVASVNERMLIDAMSPLQTQSTEFSVAARRYQRVTYAALIEWSPHDP